MAHLVLPREQQAYRPVEGVPGFETAPLVGPETGSVHMELSLCRLAPGARTPALHHSFEESWFVLSGAGTASVAHLSYAVRIGSFGLTQPRVPEQKVAGPDGMTWLRMRSPQWQERDPFRGDVPAADWSPSAVLLTPDETNPLALWAGQYRESDLGPRGPLAMPGYHGPNIKSIFVRMLVDDLLGASQHTHFMVQFGPRDPDAQYASEHYHPFEEAYYVLTGSAHGVLDGVDVDIAAGDLIWTGVGATHGFYTTSEEPLSWLEVQTPKPPVDNSFLFPKDWAALHS